MTVAGRVSFALSQARPAPAGRARRLVRGAFVSATAFLDRVAPARAARRRERALLRDVAAAEVVVTDRLDGVIAGARAGRPVVAVAGDGADLAPRGTAWPAEADVVVVDDLSAARDAVVDRLGPAALTAEALRHLPARTTATRDAPELVTVLIPVFNAAEDIGAQLRALAAQDYAGRYEVLVADNMSTDGTARRALDEAAALGLDLRVVEASGTMGVSHARNVGCRAARGELIAVCDADDVVAPGWLTALAEAARHHDMVGGALDLSVVNSPRVRRWRAVPPRDALPTRYRFLPYAHGCNFALWRDVWERSGGWDESISASGEDIDFAWRLQLAGGTLGVAPDAVVHYRLRETLRGHARQSYGYHRNAGLLLRRYAAHGARASSPAAVAGEILQLLRPLPAAPWSETARALIAGRAAALWGRVRSSLEHRTWAL